ncbi:signal recognition particle subunit SRP68 [Halyomorpha halys]|uniref:signal recognition particle subunit SRP68 n=1 Tax=Halyomorpha halys TaxID=286706 RepID=UPI0006D4E2AF|nr:signal recognition particle subunit SRP68 [Halyomorpha halys]
MVVADTPVVIQDETQEREHEEETVTKSGPVYSLEILKIITDCQQQHGLRHSDYQRYRGYCTRRIQRLRQTLHFPQGDKRHFKRKDVTEAHLKDERFLHIPLMLSERAWGYAMQLRQEANTEPRKRFHLASKLRKAVKYAEQLEQLCQSELCDARSKLEAQAYVAWMRASLHFELHVWNKALDHFQQAQVVYEKLCGVVKETDLPVYKHKCDELIPNLRYCAYSIGDSTAITDLKDLRGIAHGDILDKLDRLMLEARAKDGSGVAEVEWQGYKISVRPAEVGSFLLADQELQIESPGGQAEVDLLERHVIRCKDAISAVRDVISAEQGGKLKTEGHPLQMLLSYLTYIRLSRSNERVRIMIELAKAEQDAAGQETEPESQDLLGEVKKGKPHELIRLYEVILQNLNEMQQLTGLENNNDFQAEMDATITAYKAFRCYYIGEVLTATKKFREALALYDKGLKYLTGLVSSKVQAEVKGELETLEVRIKMSRCICIAQGVLQNEATKALDSGDSSALNVHQDPKALMKVPLIDRLEVYYQDPNLMSKKANLIKLPPDLELLMCKPLFFDVAQNYVKFPNMDAEKKVTENQGPQQAGQGLTGFVKGLWGWGATKK